MKQYVNTYRITISDEMKNNLDELKYKYGIVPARFIRLSIAEKIKRDWKEIKIKKEEINLPF